MKNFKFCGLTCRFVSKEESVFDDGSKKIVFESDVSKSVIPMCKMDFDFIVDEKDGTYEVISFDCDKFNIVEITLQKVENGCEDEKIHICSHLDSFKKDDMYYFKIGTLYCLNSTVVQ